MRHFLDRLYWLSGALAGCLILGICLLISAQILLNGASRLFGPVLPTTIPSYADFSGYMLASASFLALAHTLRYGGHIRVNLVSQRLPKGVQVVLEFLVLALSAAIVGFALWYMIDLTLQSYQYGDKSYGIIPIPLALPQAVVSLGLAILLISLIDTMALLGQKRAPVLTAADEV